MEPYDDEYWDKVDEEWSLYKEGAYLDAPLIEEDLTVTDDVLVPVNDDDYVR